MTVYNKLTQLSILEQIANALNGTDGRDEWGYLFEDDIIIKLTMNFSVSQNCQ